jgi:chromosome segregation ATPase
MLLISLSSMRQCAAMLQVTVNMDKLQEQQTKFAEYQQECTAAIADREKAIERLKAELKALGDRLSSKTQDLVTTKRQVSVLELKAKDSATELQV